MKKKFLESWRGLAAFGKQNQWVRAQGSSLKESEVKTLDAGGIVKHPKDKLLTKVFARDEFGGLWSVIVRNVELTALEKKLEEVGYLSSAA